MTADERAALVKQLRNRGGFSTELNAADLIEADGKLIEQLKQQRRDGFEAAQAAQRAQQKAEYEAAKEVL